MKPLVSTKKILCIAALLCLTTLAANAASNLVVNPGFETGTFSGWTLVDPSGFSNVGNDPAFAHSGTYHANLGATPTFGSLSQNIATMAGTSYFLSFWLANDITPALPPGNEFDVYWNGAQIFSLTNAAPFDYQLFTFANLVATGPSTTLEFRYMHGNDFWRLDDVSVSVPESSSAIWLALPAFVLL